MNRYNLRKTLIYKSYISAIPSKIPQSIDEKWNMDRNNNIKTLRIRKE